MGEVTSEDLEVMARTLWAEARGEPYEGQVAVAWVIRNRAADKRWPRTIHQVCKQPWQFSCWNGEIRADLQDANYRAMLGADVGVRGFLRAFHVAAGVLTGDLESPVPAGTCHYHADSVSPSWAAGHTPCAAIGRHLFYRGIP